MEEIKELVEMSNKIGRFKDLVQGAGGNTSIKTQDREMLIKASGYTFSEMTEKTGFVTLDYQKIIDFFEKDTDAGELGYKQILNDSIVDQNNLRPSIETGMHVFLNRVVIHTHAIMASILTCVNNGENIAREIFPTTDFLWIDYKHPGYHLAKEMMKRISEYETKKGVNPEIIFLKNHSLIVSGTDSLKCINLTFKINEKIYDYFKENYGIEPFSPEFQVKTNKGYYFSDNQIIKQFLSITENKELLNKFLMPDDVVYCSNFSVQEINNLNLDKNNIIFTEQGIFYPWNENKSIKIDEIITARLYILDILTKIGKADYLKDEIVDYIRGMEAEKYRKDLGV